MNDKILKNIEDKNLFCDMLVNPAEPNNKIKTAHKRYLNYIRYNRNSE